jgi:hypothetical protein
MTPATDAGKVFPAVDDIERSQQSGQQAGEMT